MLTSVWNDVLLDRVREDLEHAERLLDAPAERTVLFGSRTKALAAGAEEFGCDAIMLPAPRSRWLAVSFTGAAPAGCRTSPAYPSCARADGRAG